jgi:hypothetical protein
LKANIIRPGSIANLASAATVAASSFSMQISDPRALLDLINRDRLTQYLGFKPPSLQRISDHTLTQANQVHFSEPYGVEGEPSNSANSSIHSGEPILNNEDTQVNSEDSLAMLKGNVLRLGDFIDTDAVCSRSLSLCF